MQSGGSPVDASTITALKRPGLARLSRGTMNAVIAGGAMGDDHIILIVDDETDSLEPLRQILTDAGLCVMTAQSVAAALEILAGRRVDVLVADMVLSGMGGIDLLLEVRSCGFGAGCIIVTAYGEMTSYLEVMNMSAVEYLSKPVNPEQLQQLVKKALLTSRGEEVRPA